MKKILSVITILFLLFGAVPDVGAASVIFNGTPSKGGRVAPRFQTPTQDAMIKCDGINFNTNGQCPDHDPHPAPFTQTNMNYPTSWGQISADIVCPAEDWACWDNYDIYYHVAWSAAWQLAPDRAPRPYTWAYIDMVSVGLLTSQSTAPCGGGMSGSCSGVLDGKIAAADMHSARLGLSGQLTNLDTTIYNNMQLTVTWSLFPISSCEDENLSLTSDTYTIDPALELPLGPTGSPADNQIFTTVEDETYKLSLAGKWMDPTVEREDAAVSWDGVTWTPLSSAPTECVTQGEDGKVKDYYIMALSTTFYIRANDGAGAFADNVQGSPTFSFTIDLTATNVATCESQYTYDAFEDVVGFIGVPSNSEAGVTGNNNEELIVGDWYTIKWAYGGWRDDGALPERTDLEYLMDLTWTDLGEGSGAVWCVSSSGLEVLFQARTTAITLRVNDVPGDFSGNTGTPYYNIYHATFTRTPEACETSIQIGDLIEHRTVQANQGNGDTFAFMVGGSFGNLDQGLVPGAWYMLETTGGPWWNAVLSASPTYQYDMAVAEGQVGSVGTWGSLADWSRPVCNVKTDTVGHRRVIFQMPEAGELEWRLRVDDIGSFLTNQGSMSWDLYGATQYQVDPETGGSCDYSYDEFTTVDVGEVMGNNAQGVPLDGLVAGELYAIKLIGTGYGWKESALGSTLYDMEISHNGGSQYYDTLPEGYPAALCAEQTGNDLLIYVRPGANYNYRLRVDSSSFDNNTGSMGYIVYPATAGQTIENNCLDGMSKQILDEFTWIDVRAEAGQLLTTDNQRFEEFVALVPGRSYLVETPAGQGPWKTQTFGGEDRWTTAISKDNGTTWHELGFDNPDIDCASRVLVGNIWSAKFTVAENEVWKIRVNDTAGAFSDNGGNMAFKFYVLCEGMSCTGSLPNDSDNIPAVSIQGGGNVCAMAVMRPGPMTAGEILNLGSYLGGWLQYVNLSVLRYMAWCPKHTNMFMEVLNSFKNKEPLASIYEWDNDMIRVKQQIQSYDWGENGQQETSIFEQTDEGELQQWIYDHFFASGDSVWNGGVLVEFGDGTLPAAYYSCNSSFTAILPERLKSPICFVSAWFVQSSASFWMQIIIDISAIALLFGTIKGAIQDTVYMMTGVKPWVKSSNRSNWVTIEKGLDGGAPPPTTRDVVADELASMLGGSFRRDNDGSYRRSR